MDSLTAGTHIYTVQPGVPIAVAFQSLAATTVTAAWKEDKQATVLNTFKTQAGNAEANVAAADMSDGWLIIPPTNTIAITTTGDILLSIAPTQGLDLTNPEINAFPFTYAISQAGATSAATPNTMVMRSPIGNTDLDGLNVFFTSNGGNNNFVIQNKFVENVPEVVNISGFGGQIGFGSFNFGIGPSGLFTVHKGVKHTFIYNEFAFDGPAPDGGKQAFRSSINVEPKVFSKLRSALAITPADPWTLFAGSVTLTQGNLDAALTRAFTPTTLTALNEMVTMTGGVPIQVNAAWRALSVTFPSGGNLGSGRNTNFQSVEFWHDGTECAVTTPTWSSAVPMRVAINGRYVADSTTLTATNNTQVIDFTFPARARRLIRVEFPGASQFISVRTLPNDSIYPSQRNLNIAVFGDSISAGTGATIGWTANAELLLPTANFRPASIGGTGYVNAGALWKIQDHLLTDLQGRRNDVIVFCAGINDGATITQSAVLECITTARGHEPDALIVVMGRFVSAGTGAPNATEIAQEGVIASAVTAANDPMVIYMPISAGSVPWGFGSGRTGAPAGNGNYDIYMGGTNGSDATHPNEAGHRNIAVRFVEGLKKIIES